MCSIYPSLQLDTGLSLLRPAHTELGCYLQSDVVRVECMDASSGILYLASLCVLPGVKV